MWFIDPLDGTKYFIKGRDCFSINIGFLEDNITKFGCVYIPARQQFFYAALGKGAYERYGDTDQKIKISEIQKIQDSRLITRYPSGEIRPVEEKITALHFKQLIPEGAIGTKLCLVAAGHAEAHINTNFKASKWDTLAPGLIITEAGGLITDFEGNELDYAQSSVVLGKIICGLLIIKKIHSAIINALR